jgi:fumarate reductase subunit D
MYDAVIVLPIFTIVLGIMNPVGALLYKKLNPKLLMGVSTSLGVLAMLLAA